jgi:hypothetical protein
MVRNQERAKRDVAMGFDARFARLALLGGHRHAGLFEGAR